MFENCILLVCGLPASGKSVLVRDLIDFISETNSEEFSRSLPNPVERSSPYVVVSVIYDQLIPLDVQVEMVKKGDEWKRARAEILLAAELVLEKLTNGRDSVPASAPALYRKLLEANGHLVPTEPGRKFLVVVEDNLYYSSMRYSWYQLARKFSLGFCQTWLQCPLAELERRNVLREPSVPGEVIRTMASREEPPSPDRNPWERHSLLLQTHLCHGEPLLRKTWELVTTAAADPVKPVVTPENEKEVCSFEPNQINIVDQMLRKIVSSKVKEARGTDHDLALYARHLNLSRTTLLENLRSGAVQISPSLRDDADALKRFIHDIFSSKCLADMGHFCLQ